MMIATRIVPAKVIGALAMTWAAALGASLQSVEPGASGEPKGSPYVRMHAGEPKGALVRLQSSEPKGSGQVTEPPGHSCRPKTMEHSPSPRIAQRPLWPLKGPLRSRPELDRKIIGRRSLTGSQGDREAVSLRRSPYVRLQPASAPLRQTAEEAAKKSAGCLTCHKPDTASMHTAKTVTLGCTDCHGGDASASLPAGAAQGSGPFDETKRRAHVQPRLDIWKTSANPVRAGVRTLEETPEFIRFVNPGDLRVAAEACGPCHAEQTRAVRTSMMAHGAMLWGAALYNNGSVPFKTYRFGEFYTRDGLPGTAKADPAPPARDVNQRGMLPFLQPLFRWEVSQPGNVLRIFERGGRKPLEVGVPDVEEEPGRPRNRFSNRGLGTLNRTDPVFIGLQKTRLLDPTLNLLGTNDQAGDYRSSGCSACHVIYANDRSPVHAAQYAAAGNGGTTQTTDPMIPRDEAGHPLKHAFTRTIPTSQCMVCHMHPGTNVVSTYLGVMWWDNETDGDKLYPREPLKLSGDQRAEIQARNPESSVLRGLWSDPAFLARTGTEAFNKQLTKVQFADFHGHGWLFRAVYKRDRKGNLLDDQDNVVPNATAAQLFDATRYMSKAGDKAGRPGAPVHLKDIHLERGMHCIDCHFTGDAHGNGNLYGETRNAIEIDCIDCHGTVEARTSLKTTGPAALRGGRDLSALTTPAGLPRFEDDGTRVVQRSMVDENREWEIPQVIDTITPGHARYSERSRLAKTIQKDGKSWGAAAPATQLAHANSRMTCYTCHSSWMTSCFGCHLSQTANQKKPMLHNEGTTTRNWTSYNFQVLRDDVYMLGIDGTVTGNRIAPVRSSSAVVVSTQNQNRELPYFQQQTVSAEGYSGQAFNTHVPHTVRAKETKYCSDCHVSARGDNNAVMAQLLLHGTNFVNFMGRFVYVATGRGGVEAVAVTELDEPQAVIGSDLHRLAYPKAFAAHERGGRQLTTSVHHGSSNALGIQARGEYLYVADGEGGFRVLDIAQVNQKGFSEKIVTAPVSPFGQDTNVRTRYATAVAAPSTLAVDPVRVRRPENQEQPIAPVYAYIYVADREEGLVLSTAGTLLDGNPLNNFLKRAAAFNPNGLLKGAVNLAVAGNFVYVLCDRGLVVVDVTDPLKPRVASEIGAPAVRQPKSVAIQFRYAFITDADGLKVVDVTFPERPRVVEGAGVKIQEAQGLYVARTYAYVAAGSQGLVIVDVERPEQPRIDQTFNAGGAINDAHDVKVAMTNASVFAYVADGRNGLRVVQVVSANATEGAFGFSPRPSPSLIATRKTHGAALAISKGLDRDRAVDESGNQVAVFGRRGARPFTLDEMRRMYVRDGKVWTVTDQPPGPPAGAPTPTADLTPPRSKLASRIFPER